jgi:tight adherence protein C
MASPLLFSICAFLMLLVAMTGVGYRVFYKPGEFLKQLGTPVITDHKRNVIDDDSEPQASTIVTVLHQIGSKVPSSEVEIATLRANLIRGGFRSENAVPVFFGLRIVATLGMLFLCILMEPKMPPEPMMKIALMVSGCSCGWILPRFFLEKRVAKRQEILRLSLPDALDLMVVSVEAGLGLDQGRQGTAGQPPATERRNVAGHARDARR